MRLLQTRWSTNVERVALALAYKGLDAEPVPVAEDDRSPVRALSGQDLVPVLDDDGVVVADSTAILEHLEARQPEPPLLPADPARRAEVRLFVDWFNRVWKVAPNRIAEEVARAATDLELIAVLSAEMADSLDTFEALLDGRDHLMGEFSMADCAVFPFLRYAAFGREPEDDHPFHVALVEHLTVGDAHPRLRDWAERMDARPRAGLADFG